VYRYFLVLDLEAKEIGRAPVENGKVYLNEKEAEHWLRMGVIAEIEE
jgi:hypothetical protein